MTCHQRSVGRVRGLSAATRWRALVGVWRGSRLLHVHGER